MKTRRVGGRATRLALAAVAAATIAGSAWPAVADATPQTTTAYYVGGSTAAALEQNAYNDACAFASSNPPSGSLLMLDFGAARVSGTTYGTIDYSNVFMGNPTILTALESASNAVHNCYTSGTIAIAYGTNNYQMTQSGMTTSSATTWGQWQATRANDLYSYETSNNRSDQTTAVGTDMEPSYDLRPISNSLVNGVANTGGELDYDYGSADGCPTSSSSGSCNNGWGQNDVAYASFGGTALPMPEIYVSPQPNQWAEIQQNWDINHGGGYYFAGITSESGASYSPGSAWNTLSGLAASGTVDSAPGIICFGC